MKKLVFCLFSAVFLLAGCGGGGGGSDSGSAAPPAMTAGSWVGTASDSFGTYDVFAVISPDGKFHMLSLTDGTQYAGSIAGNQGSFRAYFTDGDVEDGSFSFASSGDNFSGTYSLGGINGTASLAYVPELEGAAALSTIQGTWLQQASATDWIEVSIADTGTVTGQDSSGCTISGNVTIPDEQVNVYRISLGLSTCGAMDGNYTGVAVVDQTDLLVMVASPTTSFAGTSFVKPGN